MSLTQAIQQRDVPAIRRIMAEHGLVLRDGQIVPRDPSVKQHLDAMAVLCDQRQLAGKVRLNATYGSLLNESCKFFDARIGQSTTLTGRSIDQHMAATINQIITGTYDYRGKAIIYADTDSCYFSAYAVWKDDPAHAGQDWSRAAIIALYDQSQRTPTPVSRNSWRISSTPTPPVAA